jgi:hypothetical protein
MYVSDLKGPWLDYWVGRTEGIPDLKMPNLCEPILKFSSDLALAQPIIDRERIYVGSICDSELGNLAIACIGESDGRFLPPSEDGYCLGDTPFEAAMRCYVYKKFGPEVA